MSADAVPRLIKKAEDIRRQLLRRTRLHPETAFPLASMLLSMTRLNDYSVVGSYLRSINTDMVLPTRDAPTTYAGATPGVPLLCIRIASGPLQNLFWYLSPYRTPALTDARVLLGDAACHPVRYFLSTSMDTAGAFSLRHANRDRHAPSWVLQLDFQEAATALALGVQSTLLPSAA